MFICINIKEVDLSFNPLTAESIENVLNEPKTVRSLNMAGTGIKEVRSPVSCLFTIISYLFTS